MAVSPFKTFSAGEVLTAADLNSSFTQITDNGEDLGWPATKAKDLDGQELILDADADTSIHASTDDELDFKIGGTDRAFLDKFGFNQRKNILLGGDFTYDPFQSGMSFTSVATATYISDHFEYSKVGAMVHDTSSPSDAPTVAEAGLLVRESLLVDCTTVDTSIAAGDFTILRNPIEGFFWTRIAQRVFTISFWHKHTKTGIYCVSFRNSGKNRSYVAEYTQTTTDTWEKAEITVSASPSAGSWNYKNQVGIDVSWALTAGTTFHTTADAWNTGDFLATVNQVNACDDINNNFRLALIQVEEGPNATGFEETSREAAIQEAQRYFEKSYNLSTDPGTSTQIGSLHHIAPKTATQTLKDVRFSTGKVGTPTITMYSSTGASGNVRNLTSGADVAATATQEGLSGFHADTTASITDGDEIAWHYTANSRL